MRWLGTLLLIALCAPPANAADWLPSLHLHTAHGLQAPRPQSTGLTAALRMEQAYAWGELVAVGRAEADAEDRLEPGQPPQSNRSQANRRALLGDHASAELRELYLAIGVGDWGLRAGKQQIVWGASDGLKVLDIVNPQSFREFILDDFEDSRIALWSLRAERDYSDTTSLDLVLIPDLSFHDLPESGALYQITSPQLTPQGGLQSLGATELLRLNLNAALADRSDATLLDLIDPLLGGLGNLADPLLPEALLQVLQPNLREQRTRPGLSLRSVEYGARLRTRWRRLDLALVGLRHHPDVPQVSLAVDGAQLLIQRSYRLSHSFGAQASHPLGPALLRFESLYTHRAPLPALDLPGDGLSASAPAYGAVLGIDLLVRDQALVSVQLGELGYVRDRGHYQVPDRNPYVSLLWRDELLRNRLTGEIFGIASADRGDLLLRLRLALRMDDAWQLRFGGDVFEGDRDGAFGQFDARDRLSMELAWTP